VHFGGALKWTGQRTNRPLSNGNVACTVKVHESQRILRAVMDVRISTNACDCEQVQLWSRDRKCKCEGIIKTGIAINDDREWRGR
jgi:hypothetical protein